MIRAIIFDAHGVILTGERFSTMNSNHVASLRQSLTLLKSEFQKYMTGKADIKESIGKYVNHIQWEEPNEDFLKYWFASEQYVDRQLVAFIMGLKHMGLRCYLVTSQGKYKTEYMTEHMGLGLVFDKIFSSAEMGVMKSERLFFKKIMDQLPGLSPDDILYWDDIEGNVAKANEYGFHAEVYKSFDDFRKTMKRYIEV